MTIVGTEQDLALIVTSGTRACAIPVQHVTETMRPLAIEPLVGRFGFIAGLCVIRGAPTPVVDLKALLENGERSVSYGRFVTLRVGARSMAVGVDVVVGLRTLEAVRLEELPPMLRDVPTDWIEAIGTLDAQLLVVLRAARVVPEEIWASRAATLGATR